MGDARGARQAQRPGGGIAALAKVARRIERWQSLDLASWPSAEAQVAALADDIAYVAHDIDDGLRAHLIVLADLEAQPLAGPALARARPQGVREEAREVYELTRILITQMIADLVTETRARLAALAPPVARRHPPRRAGDGRVFAGDGGATSRCSRLSSSSASTATIASCGVMRDAERIVVDLFGRYMQRAADHGGGLACRLAPTG